MHLQHPLSRATSYTRDNSPNTVLSDRLSRDLDVDSPWDPVKSPWTLGLFFLPMAHELG